MGRIWSDQRKYETWLQVELAAVDAMARAGIVPQEAADDIRARAAFDIDRIEEIELVTQHDVIAFTTAVAERVGPSARWLHFGLTSSDVIDTAQALQMRDACDLLLEGLDGLMQAVRFRADEHRRTPMIGRTHGVHAEPMTFGLKLALWYAELARDVARVERAREAVAVGKLSGAVGTFAHLPPSVEADVCRTLSLQPAPVASQVIQRDRHSELLSALAITGSSLEKFALEIRGLQKTEIGEVEEPFAKGQKGSSAMPHKRNPIGCEQVVGLARLLRANAGAAFENNALWHERDISHSSVERVIRAARVDIQLEVLPLPDISYGGKAERVQRVGHRLPLWIEYRWFQSDKHAGTHETLPPYGPVEAGPHDFRSIFKYPVKYLVDVLQLLVEIEGALDLGRRKHPSDVGIDQEERLEVARLMEGAHRVALHPIVGLLP